MPPCLGALTSLRLLNLEGSELRGSGDLAALNAVLERLTLLEELDLGGCNLRGGLGVPVMVVGSAGVAACSSCVEARRPGSLSARAALPCARVDVPLWCHTNCTPHHPVGLALITPLWFSAHKSRPPVSVGAALPLPLSCAEVPTSLGSLTALTTLSLTGAVGRRAWSESTLDAAFACLAGLQRLHVLELGAIELPWVPQVGSSS
jgi:Leucine-rich repeat (LRR) protein